MEKINSLLGTSFGTDHSSLLIGTVRPSSMARMLRPYLTLAAVVASGFLLFLATHNLGFISKSLIEPLKHLPFSGLTTNDGSSSAVSADSASNSSFKLPDTTVKQIQNSSLGFEKVLLLNIPSRTDKMDFQVLSSSLTGFNFTVVDGVNIEDIDPRSQPWDWPDRDSLPSNRGCWRAHMNAIQTIVYQGLSSALIIEDDSDWDVNLKAQLVNIAAATQKLVHQADKKGEPHSPYGDGWDLLWLGHCASIAREDSERVLIHNDPTVVPPSKKWDMWAPEFNSIGVTNSTRVVSKRNSAICTNAYAVSLAGAQKILFHASYTPNSNPIDIHYNTMCDTNNHELFPEFECLHVYPSLINGGGRPGRMDGDSDQPDHALKEGEPIKMREKAHTYNTIYSNKMNMRNLMRGLEPEMQWTSEELGERELDETKGVEMEYQADGWFDETEWVMGEIERHRQEEIRRSKNHYEEE